eukprot:150719-Ditylum_brightwellii.AAC.1
MLKNALLCCNGNVGLETNYILDSDHQNNGKELDAAQGMLHLSTTVQSTSMKEKNILSKLITSQGEGLVTTVKVSLPPAG